MIDSGYVKLVKLSKRELPPCKPLNAKDRPT